MGLYRSVLRPLLFRADAERVHGWAIRAGELAASSHWLCSTVAARQAPAGERLAVTVGGLRFRTPIGLAAGFDKSARAAPFLAALGFGHVEVGSISAEASAGNPPPRLFRLPLDRAIVVNYGLPNDGAERVAQRLAAAQRPSVPLGINLVSTNRGAGAAPASDDAVIADYLQSVQCLQAHADYLCLNLSCPNTPDGRNFFHEPRRLQALLESLDRLGLAKPLFLKVAPFAGAGDVEAFLACVEPARCVSGFSVNLPSGKPGGLVTPAARLERMPGAVSGRPAADRADRTLVELYRRMDRARYRLIGSGGVFSAEDAYRKIRLGASLVQLLTALVYEGPAVVSCINRRLAGLLEADGFGHVGEAVGVDALNTRRAPIVRSD
ncbi:quinone-dependent dihydroorotate dehydrogenase [Piscinibacter sp.]|jgi:dihydroorotate dehydrogenase (fumarate)/dihydroorotate dehydrogenase|uniref:quinone-dependent dihydroorotate dehydrogenase n=1 Tax=Piscinibacter sp. TaxID=1903157 RepID=UPI002F42F0AC